MSLRHSLSLSSRSLMLLSPVSCNQDTSVGCGRLLGPGKLSLLSCSGALSLLSTASSFLRSSSVRSCTLRLKLPLACCSALFSLSIANRKIAQHTAGHYETTLNSTANTSLNTRRTNVTN
uniref:Putative secreted protein n=1 Tax=Anopheles marajoara TaxID=58244 RepID=A0A2M4C7C6_9DIPT